MSRPTVTLSCLVLLAGLAAGCGSSGSSNSPSSSTQASTSTGSNSSSPTTSPPVGALSAEAKSAATGDIPDTQVFLTYHNASPPYSVVYPEGWTRKGAGSDVTFSDKNNIIHISVSSGAAPTPASLGAELTALKNSNPTLTFTAPKVVQLKSGSAVKATYTTRSAPNPVTGKTVLLIVDRYQLSRGGKRVTVDLGTAKGVDNVDAYRKIINSFSLQ